MAEIRLHPDGFPVIRVEDPSRLDRPYWYGLNWLEESGLTAFSFTDEEAADWPSLAVKD